MSVSAEIKVLTEWRIFPKIGQTQIGNRMETITIYTASSICFLKALLTFDFEDNKTISDGGITVDFWFIKIHTSN